MSEKMQKKISVIIADDDYTIRQLFRDSVENSHYEVVGEASNGIEAVELSRKLNPDIAVIDIEMPIMDGISASKIITDEKNVFCTVILTSFESENYVSAAIENGVEGYITKPFEREQLLSVLDMCISQSKERYMLQKDCNNLKKKIKSKDVTNRAKLIVMEEKNLSENDAYNYLKEISHREGISVESVSELIIKEWESRKGE